MEGGRERDEQRQSTIDRAAHSEKIWKKKLEMKIFLKFNKAEKIRARSRFLKFHKEEQRMKKKGGIVCRCERALKVDAKSRRQQAGKIWDME